MSKRSTSTITQASGAHRAAEHADTAVLELYAELGMLVQQPGRHLSRRGDDVAAR